jgi:hypothetical protein
MTNLMSSPFAMIILVEATFSAKKTAAKILQCGFYWPTLFHDSHTYCTSCERYQKLVSIYRRNMVPLNPILIV